MIDIRVNNLKPSATADGSDSSIEIAVLTQRMNEVIAGIDIGGTKIAVALENLNGEKVAARRLPTQVEIGAEAIIRTVFLAIEEMLEKKNAKLVSVGIGCPSPLDFENGLVMSPSNLQDWISFPIVKLFREQFNVPVVLENDANTAALGEFVYGAGRGYRNIVYVTVSTGIGGGIILDSEIFHGISGDAGEIGHTIVKPDGIRCNCGSIGCLETICAGVHIARRAQEKLANGEESLMREMVSDISEVSAKTVVEALKQKDKLAIEIWDETCRFLAIGIANVITLLSPEAVIIGGGIAAATGDLLLAPVKNFLPDFVSMTPLESVDILPAELGSQSGVCGALVLAKKAHSKIYERGYAI